MGNYYSSVSTADQVFPVEHYFAELPAFTLGSKLGSTRFMKVTRALHSEGHCVVKIFVIHDRSLALEYYDKALTAQREILQSSMHCLPFSHFVRTEKFAALCRTFVKDTLYDRVNARPYFLDIEKRWIAFQILHALQECHEKNVCHGDIKSTNIVITSWNWVYLTDFASFKPTFLPDGDPADFSYFFDTSRRRTCYIAPERFVRGVAVTGDVMGSRVSLPDQQQEARMGGLHWSMDIFSAGCVLMEFFGDGDVSFDLSRLLAYRSGDFYPTDALKKVENEELRSLIEHMIQKDPTARRTAFEYLQSLRGKSKGFPELFYTFFNGYLHGYCMAGIPDDKMIRLRKDLPGILERLDGEDSDCLLLILSLLLANWKSLSHYDAKLAALDIAEKLAPLLPVDVVLDRLVPYLLTCVDDSLATIRSNFIVTFTKILQTIPTIRRNEGHIFRAYILPDIEKLAEDPDQRVRVTFAMHIARLAEIAMRFLELSYLSPNSAYSQELVYGLQDEDRYPFDVERMLLLRYFQSLLEKLFLKQSNAVKRALLEHGMGKLCQVFGRKLTREIILPHLVTFLNEKPDWQLRAAFFVAVVGLATFVGLEEAGVFRALLEQGLTDPEEFVVLQALRAFLDLTKLQLMPKKFVTELLAFCSALLIHPNVWIRRAAVALFVTASRKTDFADQQTRIRPLLLSFLQTPIMFMDEEESLLGALMPPLNRRMYNIFTDGRAGRNLFTFLEGKSDDRLRLSPADETALRANTAEYQLYQKLHALDVRPQDKIKIMLSKDFISKLRLPSQTMEKELALEAEVQSERTKKTTKLSQSVPIRSVPEIPGFEGVVDALSVPSSLSRRNKQTINDFMLRNSGGEEWSSAFGVEAARDHLQPPASPTPSLLSGSSFTPSLKRELSLPPGNVAKYVRTPDCEADLRSYVQNRLQERSIELSNEVSLTDLEPPPMYYEMLKEWRPAGLLVAHLHEHRGSVIRLRSNKNNGDILSCSSDGTVKLWDCARMEGRGLSNRAKYTYKHLLSPVKAITYCEEWKSFACAGENGSIHVVRLENDPTKNAVKLERAIDPKRDGVVIEMGYCDPGSQHIVAFATSMGVVAGWDLRTPNHVWRLQSDLRCGMLKTFCVSPEQSWITTGSSDGYMVTWDLRFRIPISSVRHPAGAAINRLYTHPKLDSAVIACAKGNNEVSVWDTETSSRTMAVWSGPAAPLVPSQPENQDSIRGLQILASDSRHLSFISSGTDRRIRFWDTFSRDNSYMIATATGETLADKKLLCKAVQIDGVEVVYEHGSGVKAASTSASNGTSAWLTDTDTNSRALADAPAVGHSDAVNDLVICSTGSQMFLVTASRDGIIKVWK
ncbi:Phosphoinositide 3-kinase regulatory subunit 4 [Hypsibius exemplaris]|uniref:non-specific serine/threonine protein kinase n=1 Tax=Hypsibius exemplaris TaxID=2072580 RepID=A0A1W0X3W7_HYPEX|nr:Phosphoinositide 3-kinase regulatory subunit 4 [Hypsibius exemplaris]